MWRNVMKYTTEDALKEINKRAGTILKKRERRITNFLATTAGVTLIALFAVIGELSVPEIAETQSEYGAFILSAGAGGCGPGIHQEEGGAENPGGECLPFGERPG